MDELNIVGLLRDIEDVVSFTLRKINLDDSNFAKKIAISWINNAVVISMPDYGRYIDEGRKKGGSLPPISSIIKYIRSKRIQSSLSEEQLAWAIARSIQRDGVKPRRFLDKLNEEVFELVSKHIYLEVNLILSNKFKRT